MNNTAYSYRLTSLHTEPLLICGPKDLVDWLTTLVDENSAWQIVAANNGPRMIGTDIPTRGIAKLLDEISERDHDDP